MSKLFTALVFLPIAAFGCRSESSQESSRPTFNVLAATSTTDAVKHLKADFDAAEVVISSGSTGLLCKQIENGAPADVLVAAGRSYADTLAAKHLILPGSIRLLAGNHLVVVSNVSMKSSIESARGDNKPLVDLSALSDAEFKRIAMGNPEHVPAGAYAMQSLKHAGIEKLIHDKLVFADDARMPARYVADQVADAAIVYQTDAEAFGLVIRYRIPDNFHDPIEYVAGICAHTKHPDLAKKFIEHLSNSAAREIWQRYRFADVPPTATSGPASP